MICARHYENTKKIMIEKFKKNKEFLK